MRQFLNKYGTYVVVVALVVASIVWYLTSRGGSHRPGSAFFIDEDSGQEVVKSIDDIPPLTGAKGNPSVVKVYKYTCDGGKTSAVAYYIKFTPETKAKMEELQRHPDPTSTFDPGGGLLVRKADAGPNGWVKATSGEGQKILGSIQCPSGNPETVYP